MTLSEGRYQIGGVDVLQMTEQFDAPLYVYDAATMKRQYDRMTKAFSKVKRLRINYACKALTAGWILYPSRKWNWVCWRASTRTISCLRPTA